MEYTPISKIKLPWVGKRNVLTVISCIFLGANYIIFLRIVSKKYDIVGRQKERSYINANVIRKFNERLYAAEYVDDYNKIPCYGIVFLRNTAL